MGNIIFWQNLPSIHQSAMIDELAKISVHRVLLVADSDVDTLRKAQGWPTPQLETAKVIIAPSDNERREILSNASSKDDLHVVSGFSAYPGAEWALREVSRIDAKLVVIAESGYLHDGWKVVVRRIRERARAKRLDGVVDLILAIGSQGVEWYRRAGYRLTPILPMIYTVYPKAELLANEQEKQRTRLMKLVFVGQFTNRKGIDLFARALAGLNNLDWTLTLVGDGPLRRTVFDLLASEGMTNRVEWVGNVANESALEKIAGSDWLVLPSRFDGWGAVVNEALLMGTRAIVSSRCGAADIVRSSHAGKVFLHGSESDLREKLGEAMKECFASYETRQSIRAWSLKHIDPRVVALHVNRLFEHCISGQVYSGEAPWLIPSTRENIEA